MCYNTIKIQGVNIKREYIKRNGFSLNRVLLINN